MKPGSVLDVFPLGRVEAREAAHLSGRRQGKARSVRGHLGTGRTLPAEVTFLGKLPTVGLGQSAARKMNTRLWLMCERTHLRDSPFTEGRDWLARHTTGMRHVEAQQYEVGRGEE